VAMLGAPVDPIYVLLCAPTGIMIPVKPEDDSAFWRVSRPRLWRGTWTTLIRSAGPTWGRAALFMMTARVCACVRSLYTRAVVVNGGLLADISQH